MGNESCDLDSMVSALTLAYFYTNTDVAANALVVPVLNLDSEDFVLRTLNNYVLDKLAINKDLLIFR